MKIVFHNLDGKEIGRVELKEGEAVPSTPAIKMLLDSACVYKPGDPARELKPSDGAVYLDALPYAFRSPYLRAVKT